LPRCCYSHVLGTGALYVLGWPCVTAVRRRVPLTASRCGGAVLLLLGGAPPLRCLYSIQVVSTVDKSCACLLCYADVSLLQASAHSSVSTLVCGGWDNNTCLAVASGQSRCPQHSSDALAACTGRAEWRGSSRAQSIGVTMSMSCRRSCVVPRAAHGGSFVCEHASSVGRLLPLNLFAFSA